MNYLQRHIWQCFVAGIVALLPIGGIVIGVVYFETMVSNSWLDRQGFYFFGLGILFVVVLTYLIGLFFSNVIGAWIWNTFDRILNRLPILGRLYKTLKQIVGYGDGDDAMFQRVVFVQSRDIEGEELGLVTRNQIETGTGGQIAVFIPFSPSPVNGRLVFVEPSKIRDSNMTVNDALKSLVSLATLMDDKNGIPTDKKDKAT